MRNTVKSAMKTSRKGSTMSFVALLDAHAAEVAQIFFYERELQMLTLTTDGEVSLWDAQKMSVLQTVRNKNRNLSLRRSE